MSKPSSFITDPGIVSLLADDPELLALADAVTATQEPSTAPIAASRPVPQRRARRPVVAAILVMAVVLLAAAAYGVVRYVVGSPAPKQVQVSEKVLEEAKDTLGSSVFPRPFGVGRIELAKTKAAAVLATSSGPVYLWAAPTTDGRQCAYLQITGLDDRFTNGSPFLMALRPPFCIGPTRVGNKQTSGVPVLNIVNTGVDDHTLSIVGGYVPPPATTLQLEYSNGQRSARVQTTEGFVLMEGSPYDPNPKVVIRDGHGRVIDSGTHLYQLRVMNSPSGPSQFTLTLPLRDHQGTVTLIVGPAAKGGTCELMTFQRPRGVGMAVSSCGPNRGTPTSIQVARAGAGGFDVLRARLGAEIATLTIRASSGKESPLPIHHHFALYELNPDSSQPIELIGRNSSGKLIATKFVGTSARKCPAWAVCLSASK